MRWVWNLQPEKIPPKNNPFRKPNIANENIMFSEIHIKQFIVPTSISATTSME